MGDRDSGVAAGVVILCFSALVIMGWLYVSDPYLEATYRPRAPRSATVKRTAPNSVELRRLQGVPRGRRDATTDAASTDAASVDPR